MSRSTGGSLCGTRQMCKKRTMFAFAMNGNYRKLMKCLGVDGCRAGWLAAVMTDGVMDVAVFRRFSEIWTAHCDADVILVDIPIGLPGKNRPDRKADSLARKMLGRRHSCIFSPGVREILNYTDYLAASERNRELTGKKIALQYWHIMKKVREVDAFMLMTLAAHGVVKESHPEVCFTKASCNSIGYPKKTRLGIDERIEILSNYFPDSKRVFTRVLKQHLRKDVARDDILDAMMLAVTARESRGHLRSLPPVLEMDEEKLSMGIWYHDFEGEL